MNDHAFTLAETALLARPSGALWQPGTRLLCMSDLHLGKSDRIARRGGPLIPPYETRATLERVAAEIALTDPAIVVCLGDSFDDLAAADSLSEAERLWLVRLQAGRRWVWITGNHDPGPVDLGGSHLAAYTAEGLTYRHEASAAEAEVSGHFHPKLALPGAGPARPCFLYDRSRVILPAFGAFTGGLSARREPLAQIMQPGAMAVLTGRRALPVPL